MNKFETELKAGNFVTSECSYCEKIVWPPSDYCDYCLFSKLKKKQFLSLNRHLDSLTV